MREGKCVALSRVQGVLLLDLTDSLTERQPTYELNAHQKPSNILLSWDLEEL